MGRPALSRPVLAPLLCWGFTLGPPKVVPQRCRALRLLPCSHSPFHPFLSPPPRTLALLHLRPLLFYDHLMNHLPLSAVVLLCGHTKIYCRQKQVPRWQELRRHLLGGGLPRQQRQRPMPLAVELRRTCMDGLRRWEPLRHPRSTGLGLLQPAQRPSTVSRQPPADVRPAVLLQRPLLRGRL